MTFSGTKHVLAFMAFVAAITAIVLGWVVLWVEVIMGPTLWSLVPVLGIPAAIAIAVALVRDMRRG